jgi:dUTP pyrophosphatase
MCEYSVFVKKLKPTAKLPQYAHPEDACADLFACLIDDGGYLYLHPGATRVVPTGLAMNPGEGWEIQIRSRSGLASKGIVVANSPGTVDPSYRGEVGVILHNTTNTSFSVTSGMKIAQMSIRPIWHATFEEVSELGETDRGSGGFGSTGL